MRQSWKLKTTVKDRLIKDLEGSVLSFADLGKRYGVSKQAVFEFSQRRGLKRPTREHIKSCPICQSIMRIAKKPHSDFISSRTIKKQLGLVKSKWLYHLRILRQKGLITPQFGRLYSKKMESAFHLYFTKRLPVRTIGRQVGLKNFNSVIKQYKTHGWDVPASLFKYDSKERKKAALKRKNKNKT